MRVTPLHNLRLPGTFSNNFPNEEAPSPTPDRNSQPEMRNHTQQMTDTRHNIEYFNPLCRMETNSLNRSNSTSPPAKELPVEREKYYNNENIELADEEAASYERLIRLLSENQQLYNLFEARELKENESKPGDETLNLGQGESPSLKREITNLLESFSSAEDFAREGSSETAVNYDLKRGIDIYREMQEFFEREKGLLGR